MSLRLSLRLLLFFFGVFAGLWFAKPFLMPLAFAALLAMLFLPVCQKLESRGWNSSLATVASVLLFILIVAALVFMLGWQISSLMQDMTGIEQKFTQFMANAQAWLTRELHIPQEKQQQAMQQAQQGGSGGFTKALQAIPFAIFGLLTDLIITVVYFFLFLRFRLHLKRFVIRITPDAHKRTSLQVLHESAQTTRKYLTGMGLMIACLWVMYGIGFSIAGVKSALLFAVLCGVLELVPFIGNILGTTLTILFSLAQDGGSPMLGIVITYMIVQGIQSYILEPLVVGKQVKIHPMFTILVLVLGEMVWGVGGMVLSIPALAIVKIVCDHIPSLQPYGYLIGEEENAHEPGTITQWKTKIRRMMGKEGSS